MRLSLLAAALLLSNLALIPASFAGPLVEATAPSTISITQEEGNFRVTTDSRRYQTNLLPSVTAKNALIYQLLEIEQHTVTVEGPETEQAFDEANVKVTAYPLTAQGKGEVAFTIEGRADAVNASGSFLTLTRYGCCVEQPTHAVYSLESGHYLFNATGEGPRGASGVGQWVTMGAQGGFRFERIFAYHAKITAADDELFGDVANGALIITYAAQTQALQRVMLVAPAADMEQDAPLSWMPRTDLVNATFPKGTDRIFIEKKGEEAELFTDAILRLTLDEATVIEIPLVADRLDVKSAKLPEGFSLLEQPL